MVQKKGTQFTSAFFGSKLAIAPNAKFKSSAYVNVGGNGDCGFRSVSAALINNVLFIKSSANQALAKKILELHADYFEQKATRPLLTAAQRLEELLKIPAYRAQFLVELAHALRQKAVDELSAHPEDYQGAFVEGNENTSPQKMRLQSTWIDESAIAALAKAFEVPIEVRVVEPSKELHANQKKWHRNYNFEENTNRPVSAQTHTALSPVIIKLQGSHYIPKVNNEEFFKSINRVTIEPLKPKIVDHSRDPELAEALAKIAVTDQKILEEFQSTVKRLTGMVQAGEMTKENLVDIYIKSLNQSDYLQGRIKYVGIEQGNQHFFEAIEARKGGIHTSSLPTALNHDESVTKELVHALARGISIGQINPDDVYENTKKSSLNFGS